MSAVTEGVLKGIDQIIFPGQARQADGRKFATPITMIPYYAWNNRGDGATMMVWLKD